MFNVKKFSSVCLMATMLTTNVASTVVLAEENGKNLDPSLEELVLNDFTLYFANCGTQVPEELNTAAGDKMGFYQSTLDQEYGVDANTGLSWGYKSDDKYAMYGKRDTQSIDKLASLLYQSDKITFDKEKSGIFYGFQLQEGEYEVTVGVKNPWSSRPISISLEDNVVEENIRITEGALTEKTYKQVVTDGELNVRIYNPDRTNQYGDPMVSYITVKQAGMYTVENLKIKLDSMTLIPEEERSLYAKVTIEAYDNALSNANGIIDKGEATEDEVKVAMKNLDEAFRELRKVVTYNSFNPDESWSDAPWMDTDGNPIQAHGGQVQQLTVNGETKWWWYGEDKSLGYRGGVRAYSSDDLYNWDFEGVVLETMQSKDELETNPYFVELYGDYDENQKETVYQALNKTTSVIERPKVIYNKNTEKYVMWFHADGPTTPGGSNYAVASSGVAISDSPAGPFKLVDRYRLHTGGGYTGNQGMARDMNLFVDDDDTAYVIYSSEENATMYISRLNDDYTYLDKPQGEAVEGVDFSRNFVNISREAPAMFKYDGKYYLMTSGCTGWNPNPAKYAVADSPLGPWTDMGDPCVGDTKKTTFDSQSTCIFPVDAENGKFIYMGDRWSEAQVSGTSGDLRDSRYVWLPVEFGQNGEMIIKYYDEWTLEDLNFKGKLTLETEIPSFAYLGDSVELPEEVTVKVGSNTTTTKVAWDVNENTFKKPGIIKVNGTLAELGNRTISTEVTVVPSNLLYFANAGTEITSDYEMIVGKSETIRNEVSEQIYDVENGNTWGYTNGEYTDVTGGTNIFDGVRYITKNAGKRDFSYKFDLEAGEYNVYVGYYDPWSQWARNRNVKTSINGTVVEESRKITGSYEVGAYENIQMSENGVMDINFNSANTGDNTDIMVSWVMVALSDNAVVKSIVDKINSLPEVITLEEKETIISLREVYNRLTVAQKELVPQDVLEKLVAAEVIIEELEVSDKDNKKAVKEVEALIQRISTQVTLKDERKVIEARTAYDALTSIQKGLVKNLEKLESAEKIINGLKEV